MYRSSCLTTSLGVRLSSNDVKRCCKLLGSSSETFSIFGVVVGGGRVVVVGGGDDVEDGSTVLSVGSS